MEHEIGIHCHLKECGQRDFLPFTCDCCGNKFCFEHRTYDTHKCPKSHEKDLQALFCPLCNKSVAIKLGDNRDHNLSIHLDQKCLSNPKSMKNLSKDKGSSEPPLHYKCQFVGCKQNELVPIACKACKKNFCLRHRFEKDHKCTKPQPQAQPESKSCTIQ